MKIYSPNKEYTGISASVPFCNGVGETKDPRLIQWFKEHGYKVEEVPKEEAAPKVPEAEEVPKKNAKGSKEKDGE